MQLLTVLILPIGFVLSFYLSRYLSQFLPESKEALDRKPFNCSPCLSYHLMAIWSTVWAILLSRIELWVFGICLSFLLFAILQFIDSKHIDE